jgi:CDP-paratose 2-epimerase
MTSRTVLITGGAGFIGVNAAAHLSANGFPVTVLDNLSRRGATDNLEWLRQRHDVGFLKTDVRDAEAVRSAVREVAPRAVIHLAGQVAVTTSIQNPREDFEVNAQGTLNVLEAVRTVSPDSFLVYSSTNKVYGRLESLGVVEGEDRYGLSSLPDGVPETQPLDFHSPYGCSKGAADQYTIDFARTYGLKAVTFRQSCIYGRRQFGVEDQGWVAWFLIARELGRPITIYGNGKQVRDILDVRDLVRLYELAIGRSEAVSGRAFNVGGGPANALSLLELLAYMDELSGAEQARSFEAWRLGDQPVFISDNSALGRALGWEPLVGWRDGVRDLREWIASNRSLFEAFHRPASSGP